MTTKWRVEIKKGVCRGTGICAATAPDRFLVDERLRSRPVEAVIEPDDAVLEAMSACPMEAIVLTDTTTGQPVPAGDQ